jgi:hypothetical protein
MKKVIKLKESDLINIIKRVISEQSLSLEAKLIEKGFEKNKTILVKKIPGTGEFQFNLKNDGAEITIINPSEEVIYKFKANPSNKIRLGFKSDIEAERILDYIIKSFGTSGKITRPLPSQSPIEEERFDFEKMSDEELHDLHPHIKRHSRHFKDFTPTSEYLGWRGEVDKRNLYKRHGKFHNAFDKETED